MPSLFTNNLRLDHLTMEAARRAIEQPVVRFNADVPVEEQVSIEAGLVDTLLQQLRTGRVSVRREAGHKVGSEEHRPAARPLRRRTSSSS